MNDLIKIKEVSERYGITARTLRYYEDTGLINSIRNKDCVYRLYDETAVKKIEQILILRKLNISIRDIQRIFSASDSGVVLEVLEKKVQNIDEEVTLLHELKTVVVDFIHQIKCIDFGNDSDIKLLYEKAKEVESHLTNVNYIGKPSNISHLVDVTEKLEKPLDVRVIQLPAMEMIMSPVGNPEEASGALQDFHSWAMKALYNGSENPYGGGLPIFSWNTPKGFQFIIRKPEGYVNNMNWEEYYFPGGLYAVFSAWLDEMYPKYGQLKKWLAANPLFAFDEKAEAEGRYGMSHIITPLEVIGLMKSEQHDVFVPITLST